MLLIKPLSKMTHLICHQYEERLILSVDKLFLKIYIGLIFAKPTKTKWSFIFLCKC